MSRKNILIANWKLNHDRLSARQFVDQVLPFSKGFTVDTAIAPVAPMLEYVGNMLGDHGVMLAAQNVYFEDKGAFTGEWSARHLAELGVRFCIVGHSERRRLFYETDADVKKKAEACMRHHITPIICVGETALERDQHQTLDVLTHQIQSVIHDLKMPDNLELMFAYEPVWAIGTGRTASCDQAQIVHQFIRTLLAKALGHSLSSTVRIIYGGSVTPENIREIVAMPDIDGALVGGASLQAASFLSMVDRLRGV